MFTLYQKRQFIYPDKLISFVIRQFPPFLIFGRKTFHITIILRRKKTSRATFGEKFHSVLGILERDIANRSSTSLTQTSNPRVFPFPLLL